MANIILWGIIGIILGKLFMKMKSPAYAIKSILSTFISYIILIILTIVFLVLSTTPGQSISIPVNSFVLFLLPSAAYGLIFAFLFGNKNKKIDLVEIRSNDGDVINKSNKSARFDYNKRDMIRALIISVIAIPLVYFGFNRYNIWVRTTATTTPGP